MAAKRWGLMCVRQRVLAAVVLAAVLGLPSLGVGWVADDYSHRAYIQAHLTLPNADGAWWNMFDARGSVPQRAFWGMTPWWTSDELSIAFLRPLATASHYLDYLLWPQTPSLMHAHNIVLYALLVLVAAALYRRLTVGAIACVASTWLFAIDDAHAVGTAWIASRNTLLTALFGMLTLYLFDRGQRDGSRTARQLTPLALIAAHMCSEGAIGLWGYLAAYAAFLDRRPLRSRLVALAPLFALSATWIAVCTALGYGVRGSGMYVDPRSHPITFVTMVATRLPVLLRAQFGLTDEVTEHVFGEGVHAAQYVVLIPWLLLAWVGRGAFRQAETRFFALGGLLSLLPLCAVGVSSRLLFLSGFGAFGVLGQLCAAALESPAARRTAPRWIAGLTALALSAHFAIGVAALGAAPGWWRATHDRYYAAMRTLPAGEALMDRTIMLLNGDEYLKMFFVSLYRLQLGQPAPLIMHLLGVTHERVRLTRIDQQAIRLEPPTGYLTESTSALVRRVEERFRQGDLKLVWNAWISVDAITPDGRPKQVRIVTLDASDPKLLWVAWDAKRKAFVRISLPGIGQSILLP